MRQLDRCFQPDNLSGRIIALPKREDINLPINEQLIVELYEQVKERKVLWYVFRY